MRLKTFSTAAFVALAAFAIGYYLGHDDSTATTLRPPSSESSRQARMTTSVREDNERLRAEVANLNADVTKLNEANTALTAQRAASPPLAPQGATLGWAPRYERQRLIMNYLRQIDAARSQFALENGRAPGSIHELVGLDAYLKTVRPVNGEDYASLSMAPGQPLSVTGADGMTVTYDPSGALTTRIEMPPEVARAEELNQKVGPAIQKALDAYRLAHPEAKGRPNPQALAAYFASPQDGADYLDLLEAQKAAFAAQKSAPR